MSLRLFDTYSRTVRDFEALRPPEVGLYTCGPTVYDFAHIGNLRTYVFEDILRRALETAGYRVCHVMNITDVGHLTSDADTGEDRMEKGSRRTGQSAWDIALLYTAEFKKDLARLHIEEPHVWCRATDHIPEQIEFIRAIERGGFTYRTSDGIYFDTSKLPDYGYLARLKREGLQAGTRVEIGEKRNPTDFALWKFSAPGETRQMEWDSPWGIGFPGWHIECSAMAAKYLGPYFDIHCGGEDHIMVHHPNEIAQTQAAHGTRLANFWMHGYFLQIDEARMGNRRGTSCGSRRSSSGATIRWSGGSSVWAPTTGPSSASTGRASKAPRRRCNDSERRPTGGERPARSTTSSCAGSAPRSRTTSTCHGLWP